MLGEGGEGVHTRDGLSAVGWHREGTAELPEGWGWEGGGVWEKGEGEVPVARLSS